MGIQIKGFCKYCGKEYTRTGMLRHLGTCKSRQKKLENETGKRKCKYFQIAICGKYAKDYWIIIETSENTTLNELDDFIRDIWVECCEHLSVFTINGIEYESNPCTDRFWGRPSKNMNYRLRDVIDVGDSMLYEYDFGSTTELILNIHSVREGEKRNNEIVILSRNNPPQILCGNCEQNYATWVDTQANWNENPFWCEECWRKEHSDGEEYDEEDYDDEDYSCWESLLPVCNSPRMGVCGYEGSRKYPEQFMPDDKL